ncbi:MAG TPA: HlyD family secretion protein [bacterium]|jgi:membrane fusion protein (multidrug efflux system)|nr:HlyD family secretion protein [bacterium]
MTTRKKQGLGIAAGAAALALGIAASIWFSGFVSTDNAYTDAHVATLSAKVPGMVTEVLVQENQSVTKGQVLLRLDPRDYRDTLAQEQAQLGATQASLSLARLDAKRARELFAQNAISEQDRDTALTKVSQLEGQAGAIQAEISQSLLNLDYTELRAPADGVVGRNSVEAGMVVAAGEPLLPFVDARQPWVEANFKETQLRRMRVGQKAEVEIDAIGGKKFDAVVESMTPGTGATFALIPPENATGNFTKIVQRVPVRLCFAPGALNGYEDRIVPGLSVEATVILP